MIDEGYNALLTDSANLKQALETAVASMNHATSIAGRLRSNADRVQRSAFDDWVEADDASGGKGSKDAFVAAFSRLLNDVEFFENRAEAMVSGLSDAFDLIRDKVHDAEAMNLMASEVHGKAVDMHGE